MSSSELDTLQSARLLAASGQPHHLGQAHLYAQDNADYQRQYEPILRGQGGRYWCGDRDQGDVWEIKKPTKNDLHPTQKPPEVPERAIRNSSRPGDIVMDCRRIG